MLEVDSQGELDLPVGSQPDRFGYGGIQDPECSGGRGSKRLTRLDLIRTGAESIGKRRRRISEVCVVEYVEDLGAKFNIGGLSDAEALEQDQIKLPEVRPFERAALQVTKSSRLWNRKCRRIEGKYSVYCGEGIHTRYQIGPPHIAGAAAAERVDHRGSPGSGRAEDTARNVQIDNIRPGHAQVDRNPASGIDYRTNLPASEQGFADSLQISQERPPFAYRQIVKNAEVEGVADVEGIPAGVIVEVKRIARG